MKFIYIIYCWTFCRIRTKYNVKKKRNHVRILLISQVIHKQRAMLFYQYNIQPCCWAYIDEDALRQSQQFHLVFVCIGESRWWRIQWLRVVTGPDQWIKLNRQVFTIFRKIHMSVNLWLVRNYVTLPVIWFNQIVTVHFEVYIHTFFLIF